jgi:glycosyltransferase involved in cell wall biosynthesis
MNKLRIAIDGNEANVTNRVGSNVYAFEVLKHLHQLTKKPRFTCTILLSNAPVGDLPRERGNWRYKTIGPRRFWTQWALPLYLFWHQRQLDVLFTTSHYAPRLTPIPYVSSVMDLAFLEFPTQFRRRDLFQLKHWTRYSVQNAKKVITISKFSKESIHEVYQKPLHDIIVAPPAVALPKDYSPLRWKAFLRKYQIQTNQYFLYLGTLQPRKNLITLVEAFEAFCRTQAAGQLKKKSSSHKTERLPQLVIAGKLGWLTDQLQQRIKKSALSGQIILTGFVSEDLKRPLYEHARATVLIGLYEGFGIPPLESLSVGTLPIVSKTTSLPEVVGAAGLMVNPDNSADIARTLKTAWEMSPSKLKQMTRKAKKQAGKFSWVKTGRLILKTIEQTAKHENN